MICTVHNPAMNNTQMNTHTQMQRTYYRSKLQSSSAVVFVNVLRGVLVEMCTARFPEVVDRECTYFSDNDSDR